MKKHMLKGMAVACIFGCGIAAQAQGSQGIAKLNQLLTDVQNAMPNASLSDDQKTKLQGDLDSIKKQLQDAQDSGSRPDRDAIMATVSDMRSIVDSGAFKGKDQKSLDKEFDGLSRH